jgi:hypothetical protein
MQVRPRLSQHGGTDRLSGLFEAVKLLMPEEASEETAPAEEAKTTEPIEGAEDEYEGSEEAFAEELPEVPRPPLKLSKEDWLLLDEWMRDYVKTLFDHQKQGFSITDEPSPRLEESVAADEVNPPEVEIEAIRISDFDSSKVFVKAFGPVSKELLSKAITRKVLYTPASHDFLFTSEHDIRDTIVVNREDGDASDLISFAAGAIGSTGAELEQMIHEDGFTFVCYRQEGVRVVFSIACSQPLLSLPIAVVGVNRKSVISVADKIRAVLRAPA